MNIRIDPVDFWRWAKTVPPYKFVLVGLVDLTLMLLGKIVAFCINRLVDVMNLLTRICRRLYTWTGFIPSVMDPADGPKEIGTVSLNDPEHGRECVFCHNQTGESMRTHMVCWKRWAREADQAIAYMEADQAIDFPDTLKG